MDDHLEIFGELLIQSLGVDPFEVKEIPLPEDERPLHLFIFRDYPEEDLNTFVTYGLSEAKHPKWHFGRPELILSVESDRDTWGIALAFIVSEFRGKKMFSSGSTYMLDRTIVDESDMTGFVIFEPSFLEAEESTFQLPDRTVYLAQAYPIYPEEARLIEREGFERFWMDEALEDVYDVQREEILGSENET